MDTLKDQLPIFEVGKTQWEPEFHSSWNGQPVLGSEEIESSSKETPEEAGKIAMSQEVELN